MNGDKRFLPLQPLVLFYHMQRQKSIKMRLLLPLFGLVLGINKSTITVIIRKAEK
jgi:hypothetical protein